MAACTQLGLWQLHVAQDKGLADALRKAHEARPALIDSVVHPHEAFPNPQSNRAVTAIGTYAGSDQFLVGPRRLGGQTGYWVVAPLDVTETGARLAVVRGFVTDVTRPLEPPSGPVSVAGSLAPGEAPAAAPTGLPPWPRLDRLLAARQRMARRALQRVRLRPDGQDRHRRRDPRPGGPRKGAAARGDRRAEVAQRGIRAA